MAHTLNTNHSVFITLGDAALSAVKSAGAAIGRFFLKVMEANSRADQIEKLKNLTDQELATKYGINRDGIVPYVFRDQMY